MKKITAAIDKQGKITTDFGGFEGSSCFKEAQNLAERLKELGVEIDVQSTQPKEEGGVRNSQNHLVREGE